ncbi:transmembrane amino acid transporter protein-domain-containing protein [Aspergillus parasiticus]|uniref:Transmembrane amino acid transporter protein-domain-containing protein n=1 Tax=Aspergillus parasiticus TaxID=5067 RepID=A0A5N6DZX8_ASPPA|nr:transmembrane amino acid transporter protein-domain-containing protein [Aspergillus parasiticus]
MSKTKEDPNELAPVPSQAGEVRDMPTYVTDDVFGEVTENGPNYRNVGWIGTVALMMKSQIGLGVLSIPTAFDTLGIVPGIICLIAIAVITTWSDYMIGVFKLRHRSVYSIDDVDWIFVSGSGMLSLSIGLNAVSTHGVCTAVFVAVAAILGFMFSSIRTLGHITWLAWVGLVCILTAILMVTIAVGVEERPASAPKDGVWVSDFKIANNPSFSEGITAVSSLVFAYSGTPGFFNIVSEMRDPRHYTRALLICQAGVTAVYITIGCVVYYYCGSYVASPALGSAGPIMKKISYGFALPGLLVTTTLVTHIPAKYIFIRILRGSRHLTANTLTHWATWLSCTFGITIIAYVIASAIPVFNSLVSLIGALLGTLMSFQPMGCMWLYDNWSKGKQERSLRWMLMVCWSVFVVVIGTFLMVAGTYGCIVSVIDTYNASGGSAAWSCADNSNST